MEPIAEAGWYWAHNIVRPLWDTDLAGAEAAYCAILVAYRAGLREGLARTGQTPIEIDYSDFDITGQMDRFDADMARRYDWPTTKRTAP